jgi:hypothetical protein
MNDIDVLLKSTIVRKRSYFEAILTFMIKIAFKKEFKFMLMCFRSILLFLRVLLSSLHFSSLLESRAFRQKDASRFWLFRKLMNSRVIRAMWWTTTTTRNLTWMTTIVRIVFNVVVFQLIVVVSRISSETNVLNRKSRVFRYVLNSCVYDFLFNYRRFRFVFISFFINCQTFVSFFASTKYQRKHSWRSERFYNFIWLFKIASEMIEKKLTKLTKKWYKFMKRNCFLWKISRTRFTFLSNERFLKCMISIWILKSN